MQMVSVTTARQVNYPTCENCAALYPLPTHSLRSFVEEGGLAPTGS